MVISLFFGALIGVLGVIGLMDIGVIQSITNITYALYNLLLIFILRQNKQWYVKVAWAQVIASLVVFAIALITVLHDEFRIAWFYIAIYLAYMLLGERAGNILTFVSILIIVLTHTYLDLQLSDTAIATAIFSLIVFGLLSRVYNTQIKNYENALQNKNYDLAEGIKKLDIALDGAHAASKTKSLFLANMSHEIRTPMNGMLSLVQVLQTMALDERQHDYLNSIDRAGGVLIRLIDDLLDLSRIESGKLEINAKKFRVWEFLEDILLHAEYLFDDKDVNFNVDVDDEIPACLITDEVRLKQVVLNLINNAVKFTSQGEVNLVITGNKADDNNFKLHIEVNDTGIGIPEGSRDSIFEPFQQVSPTRIYNKGVGLGLPICKRIVDALKGKIKIDSIEGKGTHVVLDFTFPMAEDDEAGEVKTTIKVVLEPVTILLVEDDKISRLAVKTWLKDKGHNVIIAENGKRAVDYLQHNNVDVILMDVHMPVMNGIEATKSIKEKRLSKAPIIGMTASVMNDECKSYTKAGMDVLIEKPVNFDKLIKIIKDKINNN
jgi:signal transduction histidine kinase/CheY-like chemotaxis protein